MAEKDLLLRRAGAGQEALDMGPEVLGNTWAQQLKQLRDSSIHQHREVCKSRQINAFQPETGWERQAPLPQGQLLTPASDHFGTSQYSDK